MYEGTPVSIRLSARPTVLVGPNGAGKTSVLRNLKSQLQALLASRGSTLKVRLLASGRGSPVERFRAAIDSPGGREMARATVGHISYAPNWSEIESVTGDYLALHDRGDLRLKVQSRLQSYFSRSIRLQWTQNGLEISIMPIGGGNAYGANDEASGILQLVPLLAALYNDSVGALIIDEPEISLHPQFQAFLLQELASVAGDPIASPEHKKIIVFATHSPTMLGVDSIADLPNVVFFRDKKTPPVQIEPAAPELKGRKLAGLVSRLTATHRLAFFAESVLLVEGVSDETIVYQLARALSHPLLVSNTQVIPITGKGEFPSVYGLFHLMGKKVFILADLDAIADGNELVNLYNTHPDANQIAAELGHHSLAAMDTRFRSDARAAVEGHWDEIEPVASAHPYWAGTPADERNADTRFRATLASLFGPSASELMKSAAAANLGDIRSRLLAILGALERMGCFVLRRGTIEDYFLTRPIAGQSKPEAAAEEATTFDRSAGLAENYDDVLRAVRAAPPLHKVDENALLRERLAAALGAAFQTATSSMSTDDLNARVASAIGPDASLFLLENLSTSDRRQLRVSINSPLFASAKFPFEISERDNLTDVVRAQLPPVS